ncbi:MAG: ribonuclease III [Bryobacteraceae bacterium]
MPADLQALEAALGYAFRDRDLLIRALTHKSRAFEIYPPETVVSFDNEQLEFLGDAILGFIASEILLLRHPRYSEGRLTKLKAHLVSSAHLYRAAQRLSLGDYLLLGRSEEVTGGRMKKGLLANAVEAIIAAIYLDGGMQQAAAFVTRHLFDGYEISAAGEQSDFKSALQELAQSLKLPAPRYVIVKESGPAHAKTFTVEARIGQEVARQAEGSSKKAASQKAAELVLEELHAREQSG